MRFLVCERQVGQGCDYTIGCGSWLLNFILLKSGILFKKI